MIVISEKSFIHIVLIDKVHSFNQKDKLIRSIIEQLLKQNISSSCIYVDPFLIPSSKESKKVNETSSDIEHKHLTNCFFIVINPGTWVSFYKKIGWELLITQDIKNAPKPSELRENFQKQNNKIIVIDYVSPKKIKSKISLNRHCKECFFINKAINQGKYYSKGNPLSPEVIVVSSNGVKPYHLMPSIITGLFDHSDPIKEINGLYVRESQIQLIEYVVEGFKKI